MLNSLAWEDIELRCVQFLLINLRKYELLTQLYRVQLSQVERPLVRCAHQGLTEPKISLSPSLNRGVTHVNMSCWLHSFDNAHR